MYGREVLYLEICRVQGLGLKALDVWVQTLGISGFGFGLCEVHFGSRRIHTTNTKILQDDENPQTSGSMGVWYIVVSLNRGTPIQPPKIL